MGVHKVTGNARKRLRKELDLLNTEFQNMPRHTRANFEGIHMVNQMNEIQMQLGIPCTNWVAMIRQSA